MPEKPLPPPPPPASPRPERKSLISGASLSELLAGSGPSGTDAEENAALSVVQETDPQCSRKLTESRDKILALIRAKRPRFVPAFEQMTVRDNVIALSVPTAELREEILRNQTAMLMRIAELAGIAGRIDLEVTVNEQIKAARPIKLEDKMKFLTEKNPLLTDLRKTLDLEME